MSVNAQLAQLVKLYIAGSAAAAEVITAVTVGYPTILAITGHAGVANGDVITMAGFTGADAADLNGLTATVKNYATGATNDTFAIDINTVGKTITVDGSTTVTPTAWIEVKEIKAINPSGGSASPIDVTDLSSTAMEFLTGLQDHGTLGFDINILETDSGQAACLAAFAASTSKSYKIVSALPKTRTFTASVTKWPTIPTHTVNGVQVGSAELKISGEVVVS